MMKNERLLREWVRDVLLCETAPGQNLSDEELDALQRYQGIDWAEIVQGTVKDQIKNLAKLTKERFGSSPLVGPFNAKGELTISRGNPAGDAWFDAFNDGKGVDGEAANPGIAAEDGMIALYNVVQPGSVIVPGGGKTRGAAGEDITSAKSGETVELKTSKAASLNTEFNSTAPKDDSSRFYVWMFNREKEGPKQAYIVNSSFLYYRNFLSAGGSEPNQILDPNTGLIDKTIVADAVADKIQDVMGKRDFKTKLESAFLSPAEAAEDTYVIQVGGISCRIRIMFSMRALPKGAAVPDVEIPLGIEGILGGASNGGPSGT